jgi:uncharacterized protein (UPF0297 family)
MNLDLITYGNPNLEQIGFLQKESFLDPLFSELSTYTFPKNSSEATKEELNQIVDYLNTLSGKEEYIKRYAIYDKHLRKYFIDGMVKGGENEEEIKKLILDILSDITPLLFKLKFHFQRPRPYQLAEYYKLKLFPYKSFSASSPSFPSGHAYEGRIITEVIGNRYPKTYSFMQDVFKDICYSRIYMGLHYESDIDVGIFCAEKVLADREFKTKYKL